LPGSSGTGSCQYTRILFERDFRSLETIAGEANEQVATGLSESHDLDFQHSVPRRVDLLI